MNKSNLVVASILITFALAAYVLSEVGVSNDAITPTDSELVTNNNLDRLGNTPPRQFDRASNIGDAQALGAVDLTINQALELASEGNIDQAARILAKLYEEIEFLSLEDKQSLFVNYSDLLIQLGSNYEAIQVLEQLLSIPNLASNIELTALNSLGETLMEQEEWPAAEEKFKSWLEKSDVRNAELLWNLSYTYYQQELWEEAIPPAIEHINLSLAEGQEISRERLMYLTALAYSAEDFENAAWVTKVMINEFNEVRDWRNLMAIYDTLGDEAGKDQLLHDAEEAGVIEELEELIAPRDRRRSRRS